MFTVTDNLWQMHSTVNNFATNLTSKRFIQCQNEQTNWGALQPWCRYGLNLTQKYMQTKTFWQHSITQWKISTQSLQKPGNLTIRTKSQPTQVLLRYRWMEVADSWQEEQQLVYNCSSRWSAVAAGCSMPSNRSSRNSRSRADTLHRLGNSSHCSSRSLEVDNLVASLASLQVRRIPLKVQATLNYQLH